MRSRTRDEHLFGPGPKRILTLDGGGIRGALTLGFLKRIEELLAERAGATSCSDIRNSSVSQPSIPAAFRACCISISVLPFLRGLHVMPSIFIALPPQ